MTNLVVEVYAKKDCKSCDVGKAPVCVLCREVKDIIGRVNSEIPFQFKEVDIGGNEDLMRRYRADIPTVFINGKKAFKFKVDEAEFRKIVKKEIIKAGIKRLWDKKHHYS